MKPTDHDTPAQSTDEHDTDTPTNPTDEHDRDIPAQPADEHATEPPTQPPDAIIDQPELRSPARRVTEGTLALSLWSLWLWVLAPILTGLVWFATGTIFHREFFLGTALDHSMRHLRVAALIYLGVLVMLFIWYLVNRTIVTRIRRSLGDEPDYAATFDERHTTRRDLHRSFAIDIEGPPGDGPFKSMVVTMEASESDEPATAGTNGRRERVTLKVRRTA